MGRWLMLLLLLCGSPWTVGAAIVPDASVVKTDPEAPPMPPDKAPRRAAPASTPVPRSTPAARPPVKPAPEATAKAIPASSSSSGSSGRAFGDREAAQSPGETRALLPLAPTPISRASSVPLWISLVVFLFIAAAGSWLAQQRSGE